MFCIHYSLLRAALEEKGASQNNTSRISRLQSYSNLRVKGQWSGHLLWYLRFISPLALPMGRQETKTAVINYREYN